MSEPVPDTEKYKLLQKKKIIIIFFFYLIWSTVKSKPRENNMTH